MKCIAPLNLPQLNNGKGRYWQVPCNQCFACRVNRTSSWVFRLMLEITQWNEACFITLTYDDENLPAGNGLNYDDLQKFWKRLRKYYGKEKKIKYYACGEYGDNDEQIWYGNYTQDGKYLGRPHYHAIVFGLGCNEKTRKAIAQCWKLCSADRFLYKGKGVAECTIDSMSYVAGYCQKKLNGELGKKVYDEQGIAAPDSRTSLGLGLRAFEANIDNVINDGCIYWNGSRMPIPRYFRDKFNIKLKAPNKEYLFDIASVIWKEDLEKGKDFWLKINKAYYTGHLKIMLYDKTLNTTEQRRLNHLYTQRQKASLRASRAYTNKSYE